MSNEHNSWFFVHANCLNLDVMHFAQTPTFGKHNYSRMTKDSKRYIAIKEGDTLANLCEQEYGNANLFLAVAQYNHLDHYTDLTPGSKLYFPPLIELPDVSPKNSSDT